MADTAAETGRIAENDLKEKKREAMMIGRELIRSLRHKKANEQEAERDQAEMDLLKNQNRDKEDQKKEAKDFDETKNEQFEKGRIVEIDEQDLSEISFEEEPEAPEKPVFSEEYNEELPEQEEVQEEPDMPSGAGQSESVLEDLEEGTPDGSISRTDPELARIQSIRNVYESDYRQTELVSYMLRNQFPEEFRDLDSQRVSDVFERASKSPELLHSLEGTPMSKDFLEYMGKVSSHLETELSKDIRTQTLQKTEQGFREYGQITQEFKSFRAEWKERERSRIESRGYDQVKNEIRKDLKETVTKEVKNKAKEKAVVATVEKGAKAAAKSHPVVAIIEKAAEEAVKLVRGRDMDISRDTMDLGRLR